MPEPIRIEFSTVGARELDQAFASVERRVRRLQSLEEQAARKTAATTRAANDNATKAQEKAVQRVSRARVEAASTAERAAKKQADTEIREAERAAKQREKIRERSALMAGRMAEREARAEAKAIEKSHSGTRGRCRVWCRHRLRNAWGNVRHRGAGGGGYAISSVHGNVQLRQAAHCHHPATEAGSVPPIKTRRHRQQHGTSYGVEASSG
jgi:hypothetical protein